MASDSSGGWKRMTAGFANSAFKSIMPNAANTVNNTGAYLRDLRQAKRTGKSTDTAASNTELNTTKKTTVMFNDALKDIGEGQYDMNKTNEDMYTDFETQTLSEFDTILEDSEASAEQISITGNKAVAKSVIQASSAQLRGLQNMSKVLVGAQVKSTKALEIGVRTTLNNGFNMLNLQMKMTNQKLDGIQSSINALVEFNNKNTIEYYTKSIGLMDSLGKMFDNMTPKKDTKGRNLDLSTGFNLKEYVDYVKQGLNTTLFGAGASGAIGAMKNASGKGKSGGDGGIVGAVLNAIIPKTIKDPLTNFDKMLPKMMEEAFRQLGEKLNNSSLLNGLGLFGMGDVFGKSRSKLTGPKMGAYMKDALPWNGMAQKALVEVIPEYLSSMDSSLMSLVDAMGGRKKDKRYYDYDSGSFKSSERIQKEFEQEYFNKLTLALSDAMEKVNTTVQSTGRPQAEQARFMKELNAMIDDQLATGSISGRNAMAQKFAQMGISQSDYVKFMAEFQSSLEKGIDSINDTLSQIGTTQSVYRNLHNRSGNRTGFGTALQSHRRGGNDYTRFRLDQSAEAVISQIENEIDAASYGLDYLGDSDLVRKAERILASGGTEDQIRKIIERKFREDVAKQASGKTGAVTKKVSSVKSGIRTRVSNLTAGAGRRVSAGTDAVIGRIGSPLYGNVGAASSRTTSQSEPSTQIERIVQDTQDLAMTTYDDTMGQTTEQLNNSQVKLNQAVAAMQKEPAADTVEGSIVQSNNMVKVALASMVSNFQGFAAKLFGKEGFFKKLWDSEARKKVTDKVKNKLFTGEEAVFKKQYEGAKDWIKKVGLRTKAHLRRGYKKTYDSTMTHMYSDIDEEGNATDYRESEAYQSNKIVNELLNPHKRDKAKKSSAPGATITTKPTTVTAGVSEAMAGVEAAAENLQESVEAAAEVIAGDVKEDPKKKASSFKATFMKNITKTIPKVLAAGVAGAGVGMLNNSFSLLGSMFLPGGPVAGAIVGSGLAILSQTDAFKTFMFGKMDPETQKREGGLISSKMAGAFKKAAPFAIGGAVLGGLKGLVGGALGFNSGLGVLGMQILPGGILGGALLGAGMSILKNSEGFKSMLFGKKDEDGKRSGTFLSKSFGKAKNGLMAIAPGLKKAGAGLGIGALSGAVLGNMGYLPAMLSMGGPVGMGIAGLGLGIASSSSKFNEWMFGSKGVDKDGNPIRHKDGVLSRVTNLLQVNVIQPIASSFKEKMIDLVDWTKDKITYPFRLAMGPILDSLLQVKDNISDFIKDKFTTLGEGIMGLFKSTIKSLFSPVTKLIGMVGKGALNLASIGTKAILTPASLLAQGASVLTMGKRRGEYMDFYKDYYKKGNISSRLQEKWDIDAANGNRRGFLGRMNDRLSAFMGSGDIADAAREGWNQRMDEQGKDHLNWRGVSQERKKMRADRKSRLASNRQWSNIDKIRSRIVNKDLGGREVDLTDWQVDKYREMFKKAGLDPSSLGSSSDIMDLLYRRNDFKTRLDPNNVGKGIVIQETPEQKEAREKTEKYQNELLTLTKSIEEQFAGLANDLIEKKRVKSQSDALKVSRQRLTKRFKKMGINLNAYNPEYIDFDVDAISDDDLDDYKLSEYAQTGDFVGWMKSRGITQKSTYTSETSENSSESSPTVTAPAASGGIRSKIGGLFGKVKGLGGKAKDTIQSKGRSFLDSQVDGYIQRRKGEVATTNPFAAKMFGVLDHITEKLNQQVNLQSATLEVETGGELNADEVANRKGRNFGKTLIAKVGSLTNFFRKKGKEEDEALEDAADAANRTDAEGLGQEAQSKNPLAALVAKLGIGKKKKKKEGEEGVEKKKPSLLSKIGKGLLTGLKFVGGISLVGGIALTIAEFVNPGISQKIADEINEFNDGIQSGEVSIVNKIKEFGETAIDKVTDAAASLATNLAQIGHDYVLPALITAKDFIIKSIPDFIIGAAHFVADNATKLVNAGVTVITTVAPPLIEAILIAMPTLIAELLKGMGQVGLNLLGKLNPFAKEDPVETFTAAGATNAFRTSGTRSTENVAYAKENVTAQQAQYHANNPHAKNMAIQNVATGLYYIYNSKTDNVDITLIDDEMAANLLADPEMRDSVWVDIKSGQYFTETSPYVAYGENVYVTASGDAKTVGHGTMGSRVGATVLNSMSRLASGKKIIPAHVKFAGRVTGAATSLLGKGVKTLVGWAPVVGPVAKGAGTIMDVIGNTISRISGRKPPAAEVISAADSINVKGVRKLLESLKNAFANIPNNKGLKTVMEGASKIFKFDVDSALLKWSTSLVKAVDGVAAKAVMPKFASKIMASSVAKTVQGALTSVPVIAVVSVLWGVANGAMSAANLFRVPESDVDATMRAISMVMEGLANLSIFCWFDLAFTIIDLVTDGKTDFKTELAINLYEIFNEDNVQNIEDLYNAQDTLATETSVYNALHGTNLSATAYNEIANKDLLGSAWDGVTGLFMNEKDRFLRDDASRVYSSVLSEAGYTSEQIETMDQTQMKDAVAANYESSTSITENERRLVGETLGYGQPSVNIANQQSFDPTDKTSTTFGSVMDQLEKAIGMLKADPTIGLQEIPKMVNTLLTVYKRAIEGGMTNLGTTWSSLFGSVSSGDSKSLKDILTSIPSDFGALSSSLSGQVGAALGYGKYSQGNKQWANMPIGRFPNGAVATMGDAGCGPTAMAAVVNSLNDQRVGYGSGEVSPAAMGMYASNSGYISQGGANDGLFTEGASRMGIRNTPISNSNQLKSKLASGQPAIISGVGSGGDTPFTKAGHIVMAEGLRGNKTRVLDPTTGRRRTYDVNSLSKKATRAWAYSRGYGTTVPGWQYRMYGGQDIQTNLGLTARDDDYTAGWEYRMSPTSVTGVSSSTQPTTNTTVSSKGHKFGSYMLYDGYTDGKYGTRQRIDTYGLDRSISTYNLNSFKNDSINKQLLSSSSGNGYVSTAYLRGQTTTAPQQSGWKVLDYTTVQSGNNSGTTASMNVLGSILSTQYFGLTAGIYGTISIAPVTNTGLGLTLTNPLSALSGATVPTSGSMSMMAAFQGNNALDNSAMVSPTGVDDINTLYTEALMVRAIVAGMNSYNQKYTSGSRKTVFTNIEKVLACLSAMRVYFGMDTIVNSVKKYGITKINQIIERVKHIKDSEYLGVTPAQTSPSMNDPDIDNMMMDASEAGVSTMIYTYEELGALASGKTTLGKIGMLATAMQAILNSKLYGTDFFTEYNKLIAAKSGEDVSISGSSTELGQMLDNPNNIQEELLGKSMSLIYGGESGGNYAAINQNDNGQPSIGVYQAREGNAVTLLDAFAAAPGVSSASAKVFKKYSDWCRDKNGPLSDAQANELKAALADPQNEAIIKKVSDNTQMKRLNNEFYRPYFSKWYDTNKIKDLRSLPFLTDVSNIGPQFTVYDGDRSFVRNWVPTDESRELKSVYDNITGPTNWFGSSNAIEYQDRLRRAYETMAAYTIKRKPTGVISPDFAEGTNPLGFGQPIGQTITNIGKALSQYYATTTGLSSGLDSDQEIDPVTGMPVTGGGGYGATLGDGSIDFSDDTIQSLSGNDLERFMLAAQSQIGYLEKSNSDNLKGFTANPGNSNFTKYAQEIGGTNGGGNEWCKWFTSWAAKAAGIPSETVMPGGSCTASRDHAISQGRFKYSDEYTPNPGDLVYYQWNAGANQDPRTIGISGHIGIVSKVNDDTIEAIEGNTKPSGAAYPQVAIRTRNRNSTIIGYETPNWSTESKTVQPSSILNLGYGSGPSRRVDSQMTREKLRKSLDNMSEFQVTQEEFKAAGFGPGMKVDAGFDTSTTDGKLDTLIGIVGDWFGYTRAQPNAASGNLNILSSTTNNSIAQSKDTTKSNVTTTQNKSRLIDQHTSLSHRSYVRT